jgi:hypothetical protein
MVRMSRSPPAPPSPTYPSADIGLTMLRMLLLILRVLRGQCGIANDQHVHGVFLLCGLREVKTSCNNSLPIDDHDLVVRDAVGGVDLRRTPWFARKSAAEYLSVQLSLSRITWTCTPRLLASSSALAIGAEVKE